MTQHMPGWREMLCGFLGQGHSLRQAFVGRPGKHATGSARNSQNVSFQNSLLQDTRPENPAKADPEANLEIPRNPRNGTTALREMRFLWEHRFTDLVRVETLRG